MDDDVVTFSRAAKSRLIDGCEKCSGFDPGCECHIQYTHQVHAFEACIPQDFWDYGPDDVVHNRDVFEQVVQAYVRKIKTALKHGYGMILLGDNGAGKTMFMNYVLIRAMARGFTAYYTTMLQLDYNIKRGFNDRAWTERLDWYLTSDFLAIDELGKEQFKGGDSFARTQLERILKQRYDDGRPVLMATNAAMGELEQIYGATLTSILHGKYTMVSMEPGDFRKQMGHRMRKQMGLG